MPATASEHVCPQCRSELVHSVARGRREDVAFVLGSEIRRCLTCESRFICFGQFILPSRRKSADDHSLVVVWLSILAGTAVCVGIALWTLRRFHRWPF